MKLLTCDDLCFSNEKFWTGFLASSFPMALDEEADVSLTEIIDDNQLADFDWWSDFTGYYDGIFEENDGYTDEPQTFIAQLTPSQKLKIEFHPGDTLYFINDQQIGCTGPHYVLQVFPLAALLEYTKNGTWQEMFLLLLPLVSIRKEDAACAAEIIQNILHNFLQHSFCEQITKLILCGLMEESD